MREFDIRLAQAGHKVCTRSGFNVRIVSYDRQDRFAPIVALIDDSMEYGEPHETIESYPESGHYMYGGNQLDLMIEITQL